VSDLFFFQTKRFLLNIGEQKYEAIMTKFWGDEDEDESRLEEDWRRTKIHEGHYLCLSSANSTHSS